MTFKPGNFDEERKTIDKSAWDDGPWQSEPDFVRFSHLGLPCIVRRQGPRGHLCGYVAVPPGHPWHGKNYEDCEGASVHGGVTYARSCEEDICHIPKPGESDDVWWIGFDCHHSGDYAPGKIALPPETPARVAELINGTYGKRDWEKYRDLPYVVSQTVTLADQARTAQGWTKHL